ncbi:MAG: hypothetical protein U0790_08205 [Isosphaeraceae bacterium]
MTQPAPHATNRLGPFVAGSSSGDLITLINQGDLGVRILDPDEQARDYYKARCEALEAAAREFFYNYEGSRSLVLQKTREAPLLPPFVEYIYCWFAEDQLCGAILSGVTSDAGTHSQINEQEAAFEEHASEVAEALRRKYPESPATFVNPFNFEIHPGMPTVEGPSGKEYFTGFERLVSTDGEQALTQVETAYCGPGLIQCTGRTPAAEIPTGTTHSGQAHRRGFANPDCLVIYDFKCERYVRTIESIHVYESLTYLSRRLAESLGRRLNGEHSARVRAQADARIVEWRSGITKAEEAKRARIHRLSEIL